VWTGGKAPRLSPKARVEGQVIKRPAAGPEPSEVEERGARRGGLFAAASLMVTGVVIFLLFPETAVAAAEAGRRRPWASLGLGLAGLATTPLVAVMLLATGVGSLLAFLLLALYPVGLVLGGLAGLFLLGESGLRLSRLRAPRLRRVLAFVGALALVAALQWVPFLGAALALLLLFLGLGALQRLVLQRYQTG